MQDPSAAHTAYLAIGANRQTAAADWSEEGTLCFGAGVNVALWRPRDNPASGICRLLSGHQGTVKALHFLPGDGDDDDDADHATGRFLVSGGDDCALKLWRCAADGRDATCVQTVDQAHTAAITCLAAARAAHGRRPAGRPRLLASGASDATIKLWQLQSAEDLPPRLVLLATLPTAPRFFPTCLALVPLGDGPGDGPDPDVPWLLAAAGTTNRIQLFVGGAATPFVQQATLAGHEDWVRALDFGWERGADGRRTGDLLLASASQDKYVRLWRIQEEGGNKTDKKKTDKTDPDTDTTTDVALSLDAPAGKAHTLAAAGRSYTATFEALLLGHEDWIYSARWDGRPSAPLRLLTASADNSLAVWAADAASGLWLTTARLGALSKEKGATTATGSAGGFWTGLWAPDGGAVVTLGRTGSWRQWTLTAGGADGGGGGGGDGDDGVWRLAVGISGHTAAVTGIAWARDGHYLLSTSADQTTRLHGEWTRETGEAGETGKTETTTWHEMARPQIHGYDLNCIDSLGPAQFVSGADEKLLRVFREPQLVARLLARLTGRAAPDGVEALPDAADMPVLGLSNKAVDAETVPTEATTDTTVTTTDLSPAGHPPTEDVLARATLWPETEKLYGHGYEISCLAASHDGRLVASACRASSRNHAVVRLVETAHWTELRPPLAAHTLTATRLRFSPDDRFLLSVGRDRQWAVFARETTTTTTATTTPSYALYEANPKAHTRMLLDAAWAPRLDDHPRRYVFATAGRDKHAKIWAATAAAETDQTDGDHKAPFALATTIPQDHPVTAVDFLWRPAADGSFVLALGTEDGRLSVWSLDPRRLAVAAALVLDPSLCLPQAVLQLAWRPPCDDNAPTTVAALAIAGEDASVRVYDIPR